MAKTRGRPRRRQPKPGERVSLGLRVTPRLKTALDQAAKESGRSQSQEAEFRIEQSFRDEDHFIESLGLAYGMELAALLLLLGDLMRYVGIPAAVLSSGNPEEMRSWWNNPYAFSKAAAAAKRVLDRASPSGEAAPINWSVEGQATADTMIADLLAGRSTMPTIGSDWLGWLRNHLGSFVDHMATSLDSQKRDET
jgi:TraY domain